MAERVAPSSAERRPGGAWRRHVLGIDVGGTHTDVELIDIDSGRIHRHKIASTPSDPARAVARGAAEVLAMAGIDAGDVVYFAHGTTVATNALVQGAGARAALVTTRGFRDILEIRRQRQPHVYNIRMPKPPPPIPRHLRYEVDERHYLFGHADRRPDEQELQRTAQALDRAKVDAVAVCFLHSYDSDAHERLVCERLRELLPGVFVCRSSEILPEFREYERTSTTAINAVLGPVMERYLVSIERDAAAAGIPVEPKIMQSNGGVASPADAARLPVTTLASGPAAGVIGAIGVARQAGERNVITFDVGGTTADVCLVEDQRALLAAEREFAGYPVRSPMLDVLSVGAGGGSIGWLDSGGFLHVGPHSAGAEPGPACYGRGGREPTVTDANLVLGRLNPGGLLGGRLKVDIEAARTAIASRIGAAMGLAVEEAAAAMLTIVNENMVQTVRLISVERGFDPREFALVAFGGAGPLLAARLARELSIARVVVPRSPGLLCAEGLLAADLRTDFSLTRISLLGSDTRSLVDGVFAELVRRAHAWFDGEGITAGERRCEFAIDMRYKGQSHELRIAVAGDDSGWGDEAALRRSFLAEHERAFGFAPDRPMELVTLRVVASAPNRRRPPDPEPPASPAPVAAARRPVWFDAAGGFIDCPVYDRAAIGPGALIHGPAIIEQMDSTTVLPAGDTAVGLEAGSLLLRLG